ncbi:poly(3-hydroxyalkanoate) synthetase [Cenarchaeum symbiosum A]|uniref:Poly(3-hydroxyalkanoate) polymerase subunit PhaC n=1 Tax=Cenarchaeum symbiosum (strain A) TaxID=414004 RepID=A0RX85_CENSY|nr:poly(3-hydroxyalkanoate) synthetase [Cenarchaeum symbiosum A]
MADAPRLVAAPDEMTMETTPYDVAYEEDKVRLLHYRPLTGARRRTPLVIAYALINRFHILDIHPRRSWVRNLLSQGFDVYMVDWGTPTRMDRYLDFDDYVNGYLDNCIQFAKRESGAPSVSLQGYCTGGTLAAVYAALHPGSVRNLVATAPVIDGWKDTTVVSNIAKHVDVDRMVDTVGNMPPEFMYYCFSVLKPFEQGIEKYVNFFRNIENEEFVDSFMRVEKWLADTPPIPGELFRQWIRDIYQKNLLVRNSMLVGGKEVSMKEIKMPVLTQVAVGDHLVSPECSMPLHYAVGSEDKTLRIYPTGHVGMIASKVSQNKVLPDLGRWLAARS